MRLNRPRLSGAFLAACVIERFVSELALLAGARLTSVVGFGTLAFVALLHFCNTAEDVYDHKHNGYQQFDPAGAFLAGGEDCFKKVCHNYQLISQNS
jgi:hypothetical protein